MTACFTPQAEIELEEIGDYIALDNPSRAVTFIREIRQHCEKIAQGPFHYVARPDLGEAVTSGQRQEISAQVRAAAPAELSCGYRA